MDQERVAHTRARRRSVVVRDGRHVGGKDARGKRHRRDDDCHQQTNDETQRLHLRGRRTRVGRYQKIGFIIRHNLEPPWTRRNSCSSHSTASSPTSRGRSSKKATKSSSS